MIGIKENEKDYITKINTLNALNKELEAWKVEHLDTDVKNKSDFTRQYELIKTEIEQYRLTVIKLNALIKSTETDKVTGIKTCENKYDSLLIKFEALSDKYDYMLEDYE